MCKWKSESAVNSKHILYISHRKHLYNVRELYPLKLIQQRDIKNILCHWWTYSIYWPNNGNKFSETHIDKKMDIGPN